VSAPAESAFDAAPVEAPATVVIAQPAVITHETAVTAVAESAQAALPAHSKPVPAPAPAVDIEKALEESGLVLVKTDPSKVKLAEPPAVASYVPAPPRPRRAPPTDTGPLQIVETKK
jgi:hypothetical protein